MKRTAGTPPRRRGSCASGLYRNPLSTFWSVCAVQFSSVVPSGIACAATRTASGPERREDRRDVVVDRPERQVKLLGHLGVAQPFGDELEDLHLSRRQPRRMGARGG